MSAVTHVKGHMLDLVFQHGLDISIKDIDNVGISDHFLVTFNADLGVTHMNTADLCRPCMCNRL